MTRQKLPGGRGPRTGPDAIVDNQEFLLQRQQFVPSQDGFAISVSNLSGAILSGIPVANSLRIYPLPTPDRNYRITKAQIGINVVSAGGTVRASLYQFQETPVPRFVNVPGTTATFSTTATGIIGFTYSAPFVLQTDAHYFVAFVCDNAVASITIASGLGNARPMKTYTATLALTAAFPPIYEVASLTSNTNANWYQVMYLSNAAAKVY